MKAMKGSGYITIEGFQQDLGAGATMEEMPGSGYVRIEDMPPEYQAAIKASLFPIWVNQVSAAGLAYHGYKRTGSIGWTIGWAFAGWLFPVIAVPVALAQGFGKKAGK